MTSLATTATFLVLLCFPGAYHLTYGFGRSDVQRCRSILATEAMPAAFRKIESDLDHHFLPALAARELVAHFYAPTIPSDPDRELVPPSYLGAHSVHAGVDGFLFFAPDMSICSNGPGFFNKLARYGTQSIPAIVDFHQQLQRRGIHLLLVPIPAKASIYPDKLDPKYDPARGPDLNVDHAAWIAQLQSANVDVLDLTPTFWAHRYDPEGPLYYRTDTHWSARGSTFAAAEIVAHLRRELPDPPAITPWRTGHITYNAVGDLREKVNLSLSTLHPDIHETVPQLFDENGPVVPGADAPILVIGDSYAAALVVRGAGLSQQIMAELKLPVQSVAMLAANGNGMREPLTKNPALLSHKRIVVMAFSIRSVMLTDWKQMQIHP